MGYFKVDNKGVYLDITVTHASELTELKEYWKKIPWYQTETTEEARIVNERIQKLVNEFGVEQEGLARACNPGCDEKVLEIMQKKPEYVNFFN
jgi:hypothetical protein